MPQACSVYSSMTCSNNPQVDLKTKLIAYSSSNSFIVPISLQLRLNRPSFNVF